MVAGSQRQWLARAVGTRFLLSLSLGSDRAQDATYGPPAARCPLTASSFELMSADPFQSVRIARGERGRV